MNAGLLFEGIGGFGLACERAGIDKAWSSETDRHASAVLDHHWPHVKNLGDIHDIKDPPRVDVLTGGFPCQDYSVAGRGAGLAGDRGALWWQFHRLIAELDPRWVIAENVDGLTNRTHRASLRTIIGSMVSLGYGVVWRVFDAQFFGLAQRRKRVFIVGYSGGQPRPEILALAQGVSGDTPPRRETRKDVPPTLGARTKGGGGLGTDVELGGGLIADALETVPTDKRMRPGNGHVIGFNPRQDDAVPHDELSPPLDTGHPTQAVAFSAGNHESSYGIGLSEEHTPPLRAGESGTNQVPTVAFSVGSSDIAVGGDVSPSLTGRHGDPGGVAQSSVRRLTPLECERLQGFPDGWTDIPGNSDTQRYRQLGNAVAVPVVEWIMRRIATA